ncbi:Silenced mating-type M-specific polypeptide Mc [Zancudomyces culisetae]|uniref:Silenced mating-type M-specific polypeptide Mc n=2 Tax=Zancudomyces culisetae TaxID=1213189 RepID=A0A1R1PP06_ZANCU|nr:Silenced mating-type M-specific polypeptide Mc [Zancudomyces culisetae]|eukprot:OMH82688.1 Silenced mating-type M-specific polypeptide Mc [Zancudomyces culisetae]
MESGKLDYLNTLTDKCSPGDEINTLVASSNGSEEYKNSKIYDTHSLNGYKVMQSYADGVYNTEISQGVVQMGVEQQNLGSKGSLGTQLPTKTEDQNVSPTCINSHNGNTNFEGLELGNKEFDGSGYDMSKKENRSVKPKRTPRPANAFILYRKNKQAEVIKNNPGVSNKEISCIIGKMWREETSEIRNEYRVKAEEEKKKHKILYPDYKYQPRKSKKFYRLDNDINFGEYSYYGEPMPNQMFYSGQGYGGYNPVVYDIPEVSRDSYVHSTQNNVGYMGIQNARDMQLQSYAKNIEVKQSQPRINSLSEVPYPQSQMVTNMSRQLPHPNQKNSSYMGDSFIPGSLGPKINTSQLWGKGNMNDNLELDSMTPTGDNSYISTILPKQITKIPTIYADSNRIPDMNFAHINNPLGPEHTNVINYNKIRSPYYGSPTKSNYPMPFGEEYPQFYNKNNTRPEEQVDSKQGTNNMRYTQVGQRTVKSLDPGLDSDYRVGNYQQRKQQAYNENSNGLVYQQGSMFSLPLVTDIHGNNM